MAEGREDEQQKKQSGTMLSALSIIPAFSACLSH